LECGGFGGELGVLGSDGGLNAGDKFRADEVRVWGIFGGWVWIGTRVRIRDCSWRCGEGDKELVLAEHSAEECEFAEVSLGAFGERVGWRRWDFEQIGCGSEWASMLKKSGAVFAGEFGGGEVGEKLQVSIECRLVYERVVGRVGGSVDCGFAMELSECKQAQQIGGRMLRGVSGGGECICSGIKFGEGLWPAGLAHEDFTDLELGECCESFAGGGNSGDLPEAVECSGIVAGFDQNCGGFKGVSGGWSGEEDDGESLFGVAETFEPDTIKLGFE
jgi:hypothetical protein